MEQYKTPSGANIAEAGINRFFDEGYSRWPEDKLRGLFINKSPRSSEINKILLHWEKYGFIKLIKQSDVYIEVLKPIK